MKNFKGTSGEWKVSEKNTFGRKMIDLGELKGSVDIWYHSGDTMTKEECLANANLIANAPIMLSYLQHIAENGLDNNVYNVINKALGI